MIRFENSWIFKSGFMIHNTIQIFISPDSWSSNRYESMDLQNESMFLRISYTIPASLLKTIGEQLKTTNKLLILIGLKFSYQLYKFN